NLIDPLTFADANHKSAIEETRSSLLNGILSKLKSLDPEAAIEYNKGRHLVATEQKPLVPTPYFQNMATGQLRKVDPAKIVSEYDKAFPTIKSEPKNFLSQNIQHIRNRLGFGQFAQYGLPMTAGTLIGALGLPMEHAIGG